MKFLVKTQIDIEAGTRAIHDGSLGTIIKTLMEEGKAEASYFGLENGQRTGYFVLNLDDASDMPRLLEPAIQELKASIDMMPVMDAAELEKGLAAI